MALVNRIRRQYAVKWNCRGFDRMGARLYDAPVEIRCRWEGASEETETGFSVNTTGNEVVYVAENALKEGDAVWKGKLADLPADKTQDDPFSNNNSVRPNRTWEVSKITTYPNLRARPGKTLVVGNLGARSKLKQV